MKEDISDFSISRRFFLNTMAIGGAVLGLQQMGCSPKITGTQDVKKIEGFDDFGDGWGDVHTGYVPVSDRKIRVGLVGYGLCKFSAHFDFQTHPNVEVVAVSDLFPDRCEELAKVAKCNKKYSSLEEMVKDDSIEAVFIATDAPSHARHSILALNHGKHVAVAVPAIFGSLEEADELYSAVKSSGRKYMMFETSCYKEDLYAMSQIHQAGGFGEIIYSEGEYIHYSPKPLPSYNGWRDGNPPMFYLTHATAYYVGVTGGHFTEVACHGKESHLGYLKGGNNRYRNPFGTQVAIFKTENGNISRMICSKDTNAKGTEVGRLKGELGSYDRPTKYYGSLKTLPDVKRPLLPRGVRPGGHGGSHGNLTEEFIRSILEDRHPLVNIAQALNMSIPGIVAHQSCLRDSETLKVPHYKMWG